MDYEAKEIFMMVKSINKSKRQIDIICNAATLDRDSELIHYKAWIRTIPKFMLNPVLLAAHNYREPVVGKFISMVADEDGLKGTIEFAPTDEGQKFWALYSGGYQRAFSVGFIPQKWTTVTDAHAKEGKVEIVVDGNKEEVPYQPGMSAIFTDVELLETSCVPVPCNRESLAQLMVNTYKSLGKALEDESKFESKAVYNKEGEFVGMECDKDMLTKTFMSENHLVSPFDEDTQKQEDEAGKCPRFYVRDMPLKIGKPTTLVYGINANGEHVLLAERYPNSWWFKGEKSPTCRQAGETVDECRERKIPELMEEGMEQDQAIAAASSMCATACSEGTTECPDCKQKNCTCTTLKCLKCDKGYRYHRKDVGEVQPNLCEECRKTHCICTDCGKVIERAETPFNLCKECLKKSQAAGNNITAIGEALTQFIQLADNINENILSLGNAIKELKLTGTAQGKTAEELETERKKKVEDEKAFKLLQVISDKLKTIKPE